MPEPLKNVMLVMNAAGMLMLPPAALKDGDKRAHGAVAAVLSRV